VALIGAQVDQQANMTGFGRGETGAGEDRRG